MAVKEKSVSPRRYVQSEWQRRIEHFMRLANQGIREWPEMPSEAERKLRAMLIMEEAMETVAALGVTIFDDWADVLVIDKLAFQPSLIADFDMAAAADGCIDCIVISIGTLSTLGCADAALMNLVLDANDKKQEGPISPEGKRLKPPGWLPPDIATELRAQGWEG